ncbi:ABC transporter substrate-binding protein [Kineococcus sp. SYSU DK002]|uniref:ABC transporter substrate-binding protein n=1 Tax=Kineococcus sp. SYSU DK002 TaxID=3383123 RepID=UPI003D7CFD82
MNTSTRTSVTTAALSAGVLLLAALGGCTRGSSGPVAGQDTGDCSTLTVITNRTAEARGSFLDYAAEFESAHPGVAVKFEAPPDYEGGMRTRMNTEDYGDVLNIPHSVPVDQFPNFFAPLGATEDLSSKYYFVEQSSFRGKAYGLSQTASPGGYLVNLRVWRQAGVTTPPRTPEEFLTDLHAIADRTGSTPLYTNYKDGWPLQMWEQFNGLADGPDSLNRLIAHPEPWAEGSDHYIADSILYAAVADGLTEDDPATTDWNSSQTLLATGEVGTLMMPQFAMPLIQAAAREVGASPADIGYWPLPVVDGAGEYQSQLRGEYNLAINKNSPCQKTARAWVDFFIDDSGYAASQGSMSIVRDAPLPHNLQKFNDLGIKYVELNPEPGDTVGALSAVQQEADLDFINDPAWRQELIDIARGAAPGDKRSYFVELNRRWAEAVKTVAQ